MDIIPQQVSRAHEKGPIPTIHPKIMGTYAIGRVKVTSRV